MGILFSLKAGWCEWRMRPRKCRLRARHLKDMTSAHTLPPSPACVLITNLAFFGTCLLTSLLQADSASPNCDSPTCRSSFGIFLRRHHCRHCGHVFCSSHTPHIVPLDQDARFHPEGVPSRACDLCWSAHQRWEETRTDRLNKIQNNMDAKSIDEDATQDLENSQESGRVALQANLGQSADVAASVPRDWNWSTF